MSHSLPQRVVQTLSMLLRKVDAARAAGTGLVVSKTEFAAIQEAYDIVKDLDTPMDEQFVKVARDIGLLL